MDEFADSLLKIEAACTPLGFTTYIPDPSVALAKAKEN